MPGYQQDTYLHGTFKKTLVLLSQVKLGYTRSCIFFLETLITSKSPIQPNQFKKTPKQNKNKKPQTKTHFQTEGL